MHGHNFQNIGSKMNQGQGCIIRSILPSGMGARGISLEHVENMEMFSSEVFSGSWRTVLNFKDHNQRGGGKWHMYNTDETRFYQTDDSKVTRRLLRRKASLHLLMFK